MGTQKKPVALVCNKCGMRCELWPTEQLSFRFYDEQRDIRAYLVATLGHARRSVRCPLHDGTYWLYAAGSTVRALRIAAGKLRMAKAMLQELEADEESLNQRFAAGQVSDDELTVSESADRAWAVLDAFCDQQDHDANPFARELLAELDPLHGLGLLAGSNV